MFFTQAPIRSIPRLSSPVVYLARTLSRRLGVRTLSQPFSTLEPPGFFGVFFLFLSLF